MATFLHRLGRLSFRRRRAVLLLWIVVLATAGIGAVLAPSAPDDGFAIPGTESQRAFDLLEERFPGPAANGAIARLIFVAPAGETLTTPDHRAQVAEVLARAADGPQVTVAADPFQAGAVSADGETAYATVTYSVPSADLTNASKDGLRAAVADGQAAGLTVEVGGDALTTRPAAGGAAEALGIAVAAVVLLVTFGSLAAAGLPLLTALIGVGIGSAGLLALGSTLGLSATTGTLATMLGLAVGIDYALFIVSRYREERSRGHDALEAAGLATGTAGSSVVFAGLTVVIALAGLFVVGVPTLTKMGLAAAGTTVVAVLVAITLVPALLGFFQHAVLPRRERRQARRAARLAAAGVHHDTNDTNGINGMNGMNGATVTPDGRRRGRNGRNGRADRVNLGARWARLVLRHPRGVLLLSVVALAAIAVPVLDMQLGTAGDEAKPTSTTERRAYDALADGFGPGFNGPLTIVVDAAGAPAPRDAVNEITTRVRATAGIVSVSEARYNNAGDTAVLTAIPASAPSDRNTSDVVHAIRAQRAAAESVTGATFQVTGTTAVNIDVAQKVRDALVPYLAVVVGLAFLLLLVLFRSVLVPIKAAFGFLLSVLAAIGAVVVVFQWGWGADLLGLEQTGPIMSMMPIFMVGIVFGLAMDYEVFLCSRIREAHVHGADADAAIVAGFGHSARVVVAAALIMMAVFGGFVGGDEPIIKMIGFGLATAVLLDAFIVRMTIVPAVLTLLGSKAWWIPRWLDRLLPRIDVEGAALHRATPAAIHPERGSHETAGIR
ncbi:MMPL family transporter [Parafrankia sp. FMc2]|uniref:MMPL family transporter n=1 Tax=Parafrankia sp. FMc2 TaxID=3233196 RepID=UPI0034D783C4